MNAVTQTLFDLATATPVQSTRPLIVDSFAGGGASTGIEMALGRSPDIAINHSAAALSLHEANHPDTLHLSKNIWKVDPLEAVGTRRVGLAWFSPDCKHFSVCKGGKPLKRNIRDLAWVVVHWAKRARPEVIVVENVEEFEGWGPLVEREPDKWYPCPDRVGETFKRWVADLKRQGYRVEWKTLKACDFGAPTIRERLFLIARRDGRPIVWPEPTHGPGRAKAWRTAADIIDWSIPCPSIFDTSEEIFAKHGVRALRPLAENTLARIAKGIEKFVLHAASPYVVLGSSSFMMSMKGETRRAGPMTDPIPTICAGATHAHLVTAFLSQHNGDTKPSGRSYPKPGRRMDAPLSTLTTTGSQQSVVAASLVKYYGAGSGVAVSDPLHTVTTRDRFGLVYAFLSQFSDCGDDGAVTVEVNGETYAIVDIGLRMLTPRELYLAQGFPADYEIDRGMNGEPFTKKTKVACVGNSVSPPVAAAIVRSNCSHLVETVMLEAA